MDKELLESLIEQHLSTYEIALKTEKSQTSIRYWLKKYDLKTHIAAHRHRDLFNQINYPRSL